jgi:hypothetical protein
MREHTNPRSPLAFPRLLWASGLVLVVGAVALVRYSWIASAYQADSPAVHPSLQMGLLLGVTGLMALAVAFLARMVGRDGHG